MSAEVASRSEDVDAFVAALTRSAGIVHGPCAAPDATALVVERASDLARTVAADAPVALPATDAVLDGGGFTDALRASDLPLLAPDDAVWSERLPAAGVGVTGAVAGIAESGSVAVVCGVGAPRATSLVPDAHLCVLRVSDLYPRFEDALLAVIAQGLPSNLVWISGPSRSADIEKRITLGVHGPRRFEVVLVEA